MSDHLSGDGERLRLIATRIGEEFTDEFPAHETARFDIAFLRDLATRLSPENEGACTCPHGGLYDARSGTDPRCPVHGQPSPENSSRETGGVEKAVEEERFREAQADIHEAETIAANWAMRNSDADEIAAACGRVREFLDDLAAIQPFLVQPGGDGAKQLEKRLLDKGPFGGVEALARLLAAERGGSVVDGAGNYSYEQFTRAHELLAGILATLADHPASTQPDSTTRLSEGAGQ